MDLARPYSAVCPKLDGEVLRVLAGTTRGLTGREVTHLTGRTSHSGVLSVLNRLTEHGLVDRVEVGRGFMFALNRDHLAARAVDLLAGMRVELLDRTRDAIAQWEIAPVHASLFGSAARGEGDTRSDIDLFIVRPDHIAEDDARWRAQIDDLASQIERWTGNHAGIAEAAGLEIVRLSEDEPPIVAELRSDAIVLTGLEIPALLGTT
jgi:DNA-binding transcriptional ArsR family regulator